MERELVAASTENGQTLVVPAVRLDDIALESGDEKVAAGLPSLSGVLGSVKDFAAGVRNALTEMKPEKTTVEFSIGFAVQSGKLTAMFVEGKADGSVKVTLEWGKD